MPAIASLAILPMVALEATSFTLEIKVRMSLHLVKPATISFKAVSVQTPLLVEMAMTGLKAATLQTLLTVTMDSMVAEDNFSLAEMTLLMADYKTI